MENKSKIRMNLVAIKKVDPYARDIVTSSPHVAFYTFNSDKNEWEKTDVEGAFFIYSRNAQPYHSIFINNRLNTTSFVEPITTQLELQSQPPFLLYRNERSRIRGFWFYNSDECDRISSLVRSLVQESNGPMLNSLNHNKQENVNLFKMLSDAQKEYNMQTKHKPRLADAPSNNVLEFFAAAKPASVDKNFHQHLLPNTLSVEQIEKQQRSKSNDTVHNSLKPFFMSPKLTPPPVAEKKTIEPSEMNGLARLLHSVDLSAKKNISTFERKPITNHSKDTVRKFLCIKPTNEGLESEYGTELKLETVKPALMPPTMFEKPTGSVPNTDIVSFRQEPLTSSQLVQSFNYLMENDEEFVHKLHEAYLQVYAKTLVDLSMKI